MNDKFKLTSIFNLAEKQAKEHFTLPEIGVDVGDKHQEQQLLQHEDMKLAQADEVLNEAA